MYVCIRTRRVGQGDCGEGGGAEGAIPEAAELKSNRENICARPNPDAGFRGPDIPNDPPPSFFMMTGACGVFECQTCKNVIELQQASDRDYE